MPEPGSHAVRIAEAAASAWWKAHGGSTDAIPLGVVAALALMTQADPAGPDPAKLILGADRDESPTCCATSGRCSRSSGLSCPSAPARSPRGWTIRPVRNSTARTPPPMPSSKPGSSP